MFRRKLLPRDRRTGPAKAGLSGGGGYAVFGVGIGVVVALAGAEADLAEWKEVVVVKLGELGVWVRQSCL